jgi:plastocyanin
MNTTARMLPRALACLLLSCFAARGATHTVSFGNNFFSPATLTVNVGDTVNFQNEAGTHTVTGTGNDPFCGDAIIRSSCAVQFTTPGTYPYRCVFHTVRDGLDWSGMVGTVTVVPAEKPNLVTFRLNGWTSPIVVSRAPGSNISDPDFFDDQDIFLDWAIANLSLTTGIPASTRFFTEILVDGVSKASWSHDGLAPDTFNKIEDFNLGKLPAGEHRFRLVADHTSVIDESDETDNTHEVNVRVLPSLVNQHIVLVTDFEFSPPNLTVLKGDTVEFHNLEGSHTATGTGADPFCGPNALQNKCTVQFNATGLFTYRCVFHSSNEGPNSTGMVGQVRVIDAVIAESASSVQGPYAAAANAKVFYPGQTVTLPLPATATFWRLNSTTALRISGVTVNATTVTLSFE